VSSSSTCSENHQHDLVFIDLLKGKMACPASIRWVAMIKELLLLLLLAGAKFSGCDTGDISSGRQRKGCLRASDENDPLQQSRLQLNLPPSLLLRAKDIF
jgi:hypothetical protein